MRASRVRVPIWGVMVAVAVAALTLAAGFEIARNRDILSYAAIVAAISVSSAPFVFFLTIVWKLCKDRGRRGRARIAP